MKYSSCILYYYSYLGKIVNNQNLNAEQYGSYLCWFWMVLVSFLNCSRAGF